jgi:hypothetical protein
MVYFAMALALFADDDYEEVAARLTGSLQAALHVELVFRRRCWLSVPDPRLQRAKPAARAPTDDREFRVRQRQVPEIPMLGGSVCSSNGAAGLRPGVATAPIRKLKRCGATEIARRRFG